MPPRVAVCIRCTKSLGIGMCLQHTCHQQHCEHQKHQPPQPSTVQASSVKQLEHFTSQTRSITQYNIGS
eukprot:673913-Alexandrium_andersonii.AAC.1